MTDNSKTGVGAGSGEWQTPPDLYAWLKGRFAFNYDLFASHDNHLEEDYSTEDGSYIPPAPAGRPGPLLWCPQTGLDVELSVDDRAFANPPYSNGFIMQATQSMSARRNSAGIIVALLPAATDTHWFHLFVKPYAHVEFLPKRVQFIHPNLSCGPKCTPGEGNHVFGQPGGGSPGGHMVVIYRPEYTL